MVVRRTGVWALAAALVALIVAPEQDGFAKTVTRQIKLVLGSRP